MGVGRWPDTVRVCCLPALGLTREIRWAARGASARVTPACGPDRSAPRTPIAPAAIRCAPARVARAPRWRVCIPPRPAHTAGAPRSSECMTRAHPTWLLGSRGRPGRATGAAGTRRGGPDARRDGLSAADARRRSLDPRFGRPPAPPPPPLPPWHGPGRDFPTVVSCPSWRASSPPPLPPHFARHGPCVREPTAAAPASVGAVACARPCCPAPPADGPRSRAVPHGRARRSCPPRRPSVHGPGRDSAPLLPGHVIPPSAWPRAPPSGPAPARRTPAARQCA